MELGTVLDELNANRNALGAKVPVVVRTVEAGEICLTVLATSVRIEQGCVVIEGDLDKVVE